MVLVVDDQPTYLRFASRIVNLTGFTCIEASSWDDCITTFSSNKESIKAVIIDYRLGNTLGSDLLDMLRNNYGYQGPCIIVSGYDTLNNPEVFHSNTVFLQKPHPSETLKQLLGDLITNQQITQYCYLYQGGQYTMNEKNFPESMKGTTEHRPTAVDPWFGPWFDTTINMAIWWNGKDWIDASGNVV